MSNIIYQYWDGKVTSDVRAGSEAMAEYAARIGAEYLFEENTKFATNLGHYSPHYGKFKPIFTESFKKYDKVLVVDCDVFPVDKLSENIFDVAIDQDMAICVEPNTPALRALAKTAPNKASDEEWAQFVQYKYAIELPRNADDSLKNYNSGFVLWTKGGIEKASKQFKPFKEYVDIINGRGLIPYYSCDQMYLQVMMQLLGLRYTELDPNWNACIHHYRLDNGKIALNDPRTPETKMVQIQIDGPIPYTKDRLWKMTNLPQTEWNRSSPNKDGETLK